MSRLALGTVQFGLNYGVANQTGQVSSADAAAIVARAARHGIDTLDTAIGYGSSESCLGEIGVSQWRVISKLPPLPADCPDAGAWVRDSVRDSLVRLRCARLGGMLLHRARDLLGPQGAALYRALEQARADGLVECIGVSIYDPEELAALLGAFRLDLVQAPFNVVDRRLETSGWLERLAQAGIELHVRSVFLQGLLLMEPGARPARFARWQWLWDRWSQWLLAEAFTPLQACLGFALSRPTIARVVVGVDGVDHLAQIVAAENMRFAAPPDSLASNDPELINPLSWITPV